MNTLEKIKTLLPDVFIDYIKIYIPKEFLIFTNKDNYITYHYLLKNTILQKKYDSYIRYIVRRDLNIVFNRILRENNNSKYWLTTKKYINKNTIYHNYYYFLINFCIENECTNCRNVLNDYLKEVGLCQNRHKKKKYIHIRWKT